MFSTNGTTTNGHAKVLTILPQSLIDQFADDTEDLFKPTTVVPSKKPSAKSQSSKANIQKDEVVYDDWDNQVDFARLVYLIVQHKVQLPNPLPRYLPYGTELAQAWKGLGCVGSIDLIGPLYRKGKAWGEGSLEECVDILFRAVEPRVSDLAPSKRLEIYGIINDMIKTDDTTLVEFEEITFDEDYDEDEIPKFNSGFEPLDITTGGLYQGVWVVMGTPGTGKTSTMLTILEELAHQYPEKEIWFFENEIPGRMMKARTAKIRHRLGKTSNVTLFTGPHNAFTILEKIKLNPNPDRFIFFDSPDVDAGVDTGVKHEDLEKAYKALIRIKMLSALVIVSSQPRRSDNSLSMKSVGNSWAKAQFCDGLIGLEMNGFNTIKLTVLKNRFGPLGRSIFYQYDYIDMTWNINGITQNDWSDIMPEEGGEGEY